MMVCHIVTARTMDVASRSVAGGVTRLVVWSGADGVAGGAATIGCANARWR